MIWSLMALPAQAAAAPAAPPASAAETFRTHCAVCHGDAGEGIAGPPLRPLAIPAADVPIVVREGRGQMPPFSPQQVPDAALAALVDFLAGWR
jgi:mono/diheme cytochrome c family protein